MFFRRFGLILFAEYVAKKRRDSWLGDAEAELVDERHSSLEFANS
jgi:hypothetical protein